MNNKLSFGYLIFIIAPLLVSFSGPVSGQDKANAPAGSISLHVGNDKYYTIDTKQSEVIWKGSSLNGPHDGYAYISKGELMIDKGKLIGGAAEMDMARSEGPGHDKDNNLIDHLKGPDFFDVKKFPISTIVITKVMALNAANVKITANLTIKGITHPVNFAARVDVNRQTVKASAKLVIDRTDWGIRTRSGKFFDNLKDEAIADDIEFQIDIVAKK